MSFADYLTESPFVIPQTDFDLGDSKINTQIASDFLNKPTSKIFDEKEDKFIYAQYGTLDKGHIVYIDIEENEVLYLVDFKKIKVNGHMVVTQTKVWRSLQLPRSGLAEEVFKYLLNSNGIICSDSEQTPRGKEFWKLRLSIARNDGYHIGLIEENMNEDIIEWFDVKKETFKKWIDRNEDAWSNKDITTSRFRFVISTKIVK